MFSCICLIFVFNCTCNNLCLIVSIFHDILYLFCIIHIISICICVAPLESNALSPMLQAISLNMTIKKNSNKPVDPSNFLWPLKHKLSNLRGVPFDFNTQQDVAEILQVVLDELKGVSLAASQLISNTQKITVSCNTCFCFSESEQNLDILTLPVSADIQASISQFLKPEILSSHNKWFCPSCKAYSESTRETCFINSAPILIIQLCWFSNQGGQLIKDANFFICTQSESNKNLVVPITVEDEVSFINKYFLIANINHSGILNRGHYWAFIKDLHSFSWYSCNDELVFNVEERSLNNTASYILFYRKFWMFPRIYQKFERCFLQGGFVISEIVFVQWPHI